ncbi:hypothetical protein BCR44DRAFT_46785, partial [Catenaria anguillulae PL171]
MPPWHPAAEIRGLKSDWLPAPSTNLRKVVVHKNEIKGNIDLSSTVRIALERQGIDYTAHPKSHKLSRGGPQGQDVYKVIFSTTATPPDTIIVQNVGRCQIVKHLWDEVDGQPRQLELWAGPISFAATHDEVRGVLRQHFQVQAIRGRADVLRWRFFKVAFATEDDLRAAQTSSPLYYRRQYVSFYQSLEDFKVKYADPALGVKMLCGKDNLSVLQTMEPNGWVIAVDNSRARDFSFVVWQAANDDKRAKVLQHNGRLNANGCRVQAYPRTAKLCFACGSLEHLRIECQALKTWQAAEKAKKDQAESAPVRRSSEPQVLPGQSYAAAAGGRSRNARDKQQADQTNTRDSPDRITLLEAENSRLRAALAASEEKVAAKTQKATDGRLKAFVQKQSMLLTTLVTSLLAIVGGDQAATASVTKALAEFAKESEEIF